MWQALTGKLKIGSLSVSAMSRFNEGTLAAKVRDYGRDLCITKNC
jgi:hypothetical protein